MQSYVGYHAVVAANKLTHIGCFAHARRKFDEAIKAQGRHKRRGLAHRGLALIQKLYGVEKVVRHAKPEVRHAYRAQHARPMLEERKRQTNPTLDDCKQVMNRCKVILDRESVAPDTERSAPFL